MFEKSKKVGAKKRKISLYDQEQNARYRKFIKKELGQNASIKRLLKRRGKHFQKSRYLAYAWLRTAYKLKVNERRIWRTVGALIPSITLLGVGKLAGNEPALYIGATGGVVSAMNIIKEVLTDNKLDNQRTKIEQKIGKRQKRNNKEICV